ncbi:MAG: DUF4065 domain-containing protein [Clostridiales Family XIII bacterium]|jgi:uncharacterized phage-associated protein|nr:DUF4065 domain-containing protein [Clostridiales Family XIII bacterium]
MSAKYTAEQIAYWFITYNQKFVEMNESDLISPLKLQKLLYYAQGSSLALNGYSLFGDPLLAWEYGPVVRSVYDACKVFGASGIDPQSMGAVPLKLDAMDEALLKGVYDKYNKYSASGLINRTHSEKPWSETARNQEIPQELIKDFFVNTEYRKVFDGTLFDDIPIAEPSMNR